MYVRYSNLHGTYNIIHAYKIYYNLKATINQPLNLPNVNSNAVDWLRQLQFGWLLIVFFIVIFVIKYGPIIPKMLNY